MERPSNVYTNPEPLRRIAGRVALVVVAVALAEIAAAALYCWWAGIDDHVGVSNALFIAAGLVAIVAAVPYFLRWTNLSIGTDGLPGGGALGHTRWMEEVLTTDPDVVRRERIDATRAIGRTFAVFAASGLVVAAAVLVAVAG